MVNWKFLLLSVIVATMLCMAHAAKADPHADESPQFDEPAATGAPRQSAPVAIEPKIVSFIETNIPPAKTKDHEFLTKGDFATTMLDGLNAVIPNSGATDQQKTEGEGKLAKVMANLIKMVESDGKPNSDDQWDKLGKALKVEETITDKAQAEEFFKRMTWTKKVVEKNPSDKPEAQEFNALVKKELEEKDQKDAELANLAKLATQPGNAADKKKFQEKLNPETAMNVLAARLNSKDPKVAKEAETELKAAWQKAGDVPFLRFQNGVGVFLGKNDATGNFKKVANEIATQGWKFDPDSTAKIEKPWMVSSGKLAKGLDPDAKLPEELGGPIAQAKPEVAAATTPAGSPPAGQAQGAKPKGDKAILAGMSCTGCHTDRRWSNGAFRRDDGSVISPAAMMASPQMAGFFSKLSGDQMAAFKRLLSGNLLADTSLSSQGQALR